MKNRFWILAMAILAIVLGIGSSSRTFAAPADAAVRIGNGSQNRQLQLFARHCNGSSRNDGSLDEPRRYPAYHRQRRQDIQVEGP